MYTVAVLSVVLAIVAGGTTASWLLTSYRPSGSAFALGTFLLVLTFWTATHLGTLFADSLQWLLLFKQLSYVGVVTAPVAWFVFAVRYTDRGEWFSWRRLASLLVVPILTLVLVFTAQYHSIYYTTIGVETVSGRPLLATTAGPWHVVNIVYSYALLFAGTGMVGASALSDNRLYRRQSVILLGCITIPWVVNMSYHLDVTPVPWFDVTPIAFIVAGIPLGAIVVRTDLASFLPVAHERVFRSLDDPLVVVSPDERIIDANDAARRVFGHRAPLEGNSAGAVLPAELCDGGALRTEFDGPVECSIDWGGETRQYLARRQQVHPEREGVSRGAVVALTDITARMERERELKQLSEQTQRKNEQLERMADVISHDMAAPLSTAEKTLSLLRADLDDPDPQIEQSLDDLATVHDRLRGFAAHLPRLARESVDVETTEQCDLAAVARAAWNTVDTGELELTIADSRSLDADRRRLRQLFENLFRNTVEHGTAGSRTDTAATVDRYGDGHVGDDPPSGPVSSATTVRVGTHADGVFVEDDGPGIGPEQRDAVFEYGMSTGESSGFGLAIVRTIAEAHGWEIDIADSPSEGARFEIVTDT